MNRIRKAQTEGRRNKKKWERRLKWKFKNARINIELKEIRGGSITFYSETFVVYETNKRFRMCVDLEDLGVCD